MPEQERGRLVRNTETRSAATLNFDFYREPYKVGFVMDWGCDTQPVIDMYDAMRMALDEAQDSGLVDRPVDLIVSEVEGLPYGNFAPVLASWRRLVDDGCICMVGPFQSENVLAIAPFVEEARIPTLSQTGSLDWGAGAYQFGINNGTFSDEATIVARYFAEKRGCKRVVSLHDDNALGDEYADFFRLAARRFGLDVVGDYSVSTFLGEEQSAELLERMRASGAEGFVFMGWGTPVLANMMKVLVKMDWDPVRVVTSIFMGFTYGMGYGYDTLWDSQPEVFEGWVGIEQWDTRNEVFVGMLDRFEARYGRRPAHCYTSLGYDQGRVIAEAIGLARPHTAEGIRRGLERVRMLPTATGGPGTYLSYAPGDHRGFKGDYIVLRKIENGQNLIEL
jgi:ABC-type branched-subunit amino acid transport system substrate-binding protein